MVLFAFFNGDDNRWRLNQILLITLLLQYHNNIRHRYCLFRSAVLPPQESPWKNLYKKAHAMSFLHLAGLSRCAFVMLMDYLFDLEDMAQHRPCGRPPSLGPEGFVGLLFFYLGSMMSYKHLCMIFGLTPTVCSGAINWMLKKTVRALRGHPLVRVKFPTREKMREYAALVQL
jgi:hypothetical protein